ISPVNPRRRAASTARRPARDAPTTTSRRGAGGGWCSGTGSGLDELERHHRAGLDRGADVLDVVGLGLLGEDLHQALGLDLEVVRGLRVAHAEALTGVLVDDVSGDGGSLSRSGVGDGGGGGSQPPDGSAPTSGSKSTLSR